MRDGLVPCVRFSDFYSAVVIMFGIVYYNKLVLKLEMYKIMQ